LGQSKIAFSGADTLAFLVQMDNNNINNIYCTDVAFLMLSPGKTKFNFSFFNPNVKSHEQIIDVKPNTFLQYEIRVAKGKTQLFLIAEAKLTEITSIPVSVESTGLAENNIIIETPYEGRKACETPTSETEFTSIKENLAKIGFEFKRFETLKGVVSFNCLTVDQLRYLLSQLELEDNKVKITELAKDKIYDYDRALLIVDDFFLERNKNKVKSMLQ
jgi:hypothetical protein